MNNNHVNCGLWVLMMCQCRFIIVTNAPGWSGVLRGGGAVPVLGWGDTGSRIFLLSFAVKLKLL